MLNDYALINKYLLDSGQSDAVKKTTAASAANNSLAKLTPEQQNVLLAADPDCLKSTLRAIDAEFGLSATTDARSCTSPTKTCKSCAPGCLQNRE